MPLKQIWMSGETFWRQNGTKSEKCDDENDSHRKCDGGSSHQHFRFAPPWGNRPSIMHHVYPSNSQEPSNRILATASNCRLRVCRPMGDPCVWLSAANRAERAPGRERSGCVSSHSWLGAHTHRKHIHTHTQTHVRKHTQAHSKHTSETHTQKALGCFRHTNQSNSWICWCKIVSHSAHCLMFKSDLVVWEVLKGQFTKFTKTSGVRSIHAVVRVYFHWLISVNGTLRTTVTVNRLSAVMLTARKQYLIHSAIFSPCFHNILFFF